MIEPLTSIQIYAPNGGAYIANPNAETQAEQTAFPVTNSCERSAKLMGDDYVRLVFKLSNKVIFEAFSYIEYGGQTFFLKERYIPTPNGCLKDANGVSSAYYSYDVKFVSVGNMLSKATCYRHVVVEGAGGGEWDEPEINLNGTLETMYVVVMGAISQYCKRIADGNCKHFYDLLCTIPANGLTKVGGVTSPNTDKVKLTTGTELVSFSFQGDNIANVCTTIANSYTNDDKDTEWYITEDSSHSLILHFAKCEDTADNSIQQYSDYVMENAGADKMLKPYRSGGLTKVEYAQEWSGIAQTIVPYGSDRNMSGVWRKDTDAQTQMMVTFGKRLRLDSKHSVTATLANGSSITYSGAYQVKDKDGNAVILRVNAQGGVTNPNVTTGIEQVKFYDDIYPQCHFRVTSVSVRNKRQDDETVPEYTIEAVPITSTKEQLVANGFYPLTIEEATTLSVRFESGLLNGREFEIANKTHKDKDATTYSLKFTIVADGSIEDGTLIPSGNFIPHGDDTKGEGKGDEFALFNMKMPQQYVEYAQQELAQKAYDELVELQNSRPEVKCTTDPVHFDGEFHFGQLFGIKSELFGGTDNEFVSRVISYSYSLTTPNNVQFSLASAIMQGTLAEMNAAISNVTNVTGGLGQRAVNLSRRGWRDASEVSDMLNSITAEMMLVGNEKYQFAFTSAITCVNDATAGTDGLQHFKGLQITYGSLQHTQDPYIGYANKGLWEMPATTPLLTTDHNGEMLNADTPYYLYAVVADDSNPVVYELWGNNEESRAEDEAYLLLGILSSEFEDNGTSYRVFSRTNGYTAIEGGTITTEQIQDAGRNLIIDFQSNPPRIIARNGAEIIGNIRFKAGDEKTAEEQLRDLGVDIEETKAALDSLEIGGENLYSGANPLTYAIGNSRLITTTLCTNLQNGGKYIFSCEKSTTTSALVNATYIVGLLNQDNGSDLIESIGLPFSNDFAKQVFTIPDTGNWTLILRRFFFNETCTWTNIMVQKGTHPTTYKPFVEHLTAALQGSTDVTGGLVMTNVLLLKNEKNKVTAGMSGLAGTSSNPEKVMLFAGGTYEDATLAAADPDYKKKDGTPITTLIKKDGTGKIGVFRIGENSVRVVTDSSTIVITNESISSSIMVQGAGSSYGATYQGHSTGNGSNTTYAKFEQLGDYYVLDKVAITGNGGKYRVVVNSITFSAKVSAQGGNQNVGGAYAYISVGSVYLVMRDGNSIKVLRTIYDGDLIDNLEAEDEGYSTSPYTQSFNKTINLSYDSVVNVENKNVQICIVTNFVSVYGSQNDSTSQGSADLSISPNTTNIGTMSVTGVEKYAVFAKDGMAIIANANSSFQIDNSSSDNLNIIAKGLPTSNANLANGQLYSSGGVLRIK